MERESYKLFLAFENTLSTDYVTEVFYNTYNTDRIIRSSW